MPQDMRPECPLLFPSHYTEPDCTPKDLGPTIRAQWSTGVKDANGNDIGRAHGPLAPAITDVRLTSSLEGAWKAVKDADEAPNPRLNLSLSFDPRP